jgi:hypothetical protein
MTSKSFEGFDAPRFFERVRAESQRISAQYWGANERDAALRAYEEAARQALRAPALAERSVVLRRVGKRVLPASLLPLAKRVVRGIDRSSKGVTALLSHRRSEP